MKTALKIASVLTWFNLLFWGGMLLIVFLAAGAMGFGLPQLLTVVLLSAIPLSCYAALQLHKSIRNPALKLNSQAPIGIRFVGLVAIFLGIQILSTGGGFLIYDRDALKVFKEMGEQLSKSNNQVKWTPTFQMMHALGAFFLFLGLSISINAVLNIRLLRWYYLVKQSDVS